MRACARIRSRRRRWLRPEHIDSAADRMCVRVVQGKGGRDRYVPLSEELLVMLRNYWRAARPGVWLFPSARDPSRAQPPECDGHNSWYYLARDGAGITKQGGIHTLRHCHPRRKAHPAACERCCVVAPAARGSIAMPHLPAPARCAAHRTCPSAALKLTLPIQPSPRRSSPTWFICRRAA